MSPKDIYSGKEEQNPVDVSERRWQDYADGEELSPTMAQDKYQLITDQLIELIEKGTPPWRQPWFINRPKNLITGREYQGKNPLILQIQMMTRGYKDPYFIGYQQAKEQGWQVIKGCKAAWVLFSAMSKKEEEERNYRIFQWHKVFNVACIDDGQDGKEIQKWVQNLRPWPRTSYQHQEIAKAEDLWSRVCPKLMEGCYLAWYYPETDTIHLPDRKDFTSEESYWATALHELVHWTGHNSRLNRDLTSKFGTEGYAFEELIAEIGSAFLCNDIELEGEIENHASYLANWLKILKNDKQAFFRASSAARKAADYLIDLAWPEVEENLHGADETLNEYALTMKGM